MIFPTEQWMTTEQAVAVAKARGRKLDASDLRKHCRRRFGPEGLAVLIDNDGIKTGPNFDYRSRHEGGDMSGRGVWLIHVQALEKRLNERAQGPGHRTIWRESQAVAQA